MEFKAIQSAQRLITTKSKNFILVTVVGFIVILAIKNSFVQDDAFISFRYAQNFVEHNNFSWNNTDVEKLEGYTNFLWTILLSACIKMGFDPATCSIVLGIAIGIGTLLLTYKTAELLFANPTFAILTVFLLGTNYSFNSYLTGGLETQLQAFLIAIVSYVTFKMILEPGSARWNLVVLGVAGALAILTRLDSPLIIGLLVLGLLYHRFMEGKKVGGVVLDVIAMATPVLLIVLPWLFWKYNYYGDLLPNSFYLKGKVFSFGVLKSGLVYLFLFFSSYYLVVFVVLLIPFIRIALRDKVIAIILVVLAAWYSYIIKVGGDFMEYRFMVPTLPLLMILIVWIIGQLNNKIAQYISVLVIIFGTINHQLSFFDSHGIESVKKLRSHIYDPVSNWKGIGERFEELFAEDKANTIIATTAAGAIPYYSELKTIDMLGINDKWIALNGDDIPDFRPGHHKWAKLDYYLETDVNIVIGHPEMRPADWSKYRSKVSLSDFADFKISGIDPSQLPANASVIEIPVDETWNLFVLYLKPTPAIDAIIQRNNIRSFPIER